MNNKNIVAIGGGGFGRSLGSLKIERYITSLVKKKRPNICFVPTASGDNELYKLNFYLIKSITASCCMITTCRIISSVSI